MISENNEDAYSRMIDKYLPIINRYASFYLKNYSNLNLEYDELKQEGLIGLINAINSFSNEKKVIFYTFANLIIKREMFRYVKKNLSGKSLILTNSCSLNDTINNDDLFLEDYIYSEKDLVEKEIIDRFSSYTIYKFRYELNDIQSQIFELKINNFSNKEISDLLDIKYKMVDNSLRAIKFKLKKFIK